MTSLSDDAYVGTLHYKLLDPPIVGGGEDLQATCDNGNSTTTDVNLTAGNLTVAVGAITAGGDITTLGGDIISTGSVEADSDIVSDNGNITATVGNITAPAGFLSVRNDITTTTGDFLAPAGRVIASQFIRSDTGNILTAVGDIYAAGGGKIYTIGGGNMECSGKIISNRAPPLTEAITTLTDIKIGQNATGLSASFSGKVEILDECKVVGQIVQTGAANNITTAGDVNVSAGDITATLGNIKATVGDVSAQTLTVVNPDYGVPITTLSAPANPSAGTHTFDMTGKARASYWLFSGTLTFDINIETGIPLVAEQTGLFITFSTSAPPSAGAPYVVSYILSPGSSSTQLIVRMTTNNTATILNPIRMNLLLLRI